MSVIHLFYSQTAVDRGTILRMGKGFTLKNTEGNDLADMFHEAFQRKVTHS
jgi:hexokinase